MLHSSTDQWVSAVPYQLRWKWQVRLPNGICWISRINYANEELAIEHGRRWLAHEVAYRAIAGWLSEMQEFGVIQASEEAQLKDSFLGETRHEPLHSS